MSCKSGIYAVNTTAGTALASGATYPISIVVRRYGPHCRLGAEGIVIGDKCGAGYYDVSINVTVSATAAGTVTATLCKDGTAIAGATASETVASGDTITLPLNALVKVNCNCSTSVLTVVISGVATTSNNLAIRVEKE